MIQSAVWELKSPNKETNETETKLKSILWLQYFDKIFGIKKRPMIASRAENVKIKPTDFVETKLAK